MDQESRPLRSQIASSTSERLRPFALTILPILGAAAVLRLVFLGDFPQLQADEGLWTNSSKNFLVFGDWTMDGRTHVFLSPVFHGFSVISFGVFGPSIAAARLVSALAGVGSVWLMYSIVRRITPDRRIAFAAAVIVAVDLWFVLSSRWALIEPTQVFFALAATTLLFGSRARLVLSGAVFGVALLTKLNTAVLGLVLAGFLLIRPNAADGSGRWEERAWDSLVFGCTALLVAGVGYLTLYLSSPDAFMSAFRFELEGQHFDPGTTVVTRTHRWGIAPTLIGESVLELIRTAPFLTTFAAVGAVVAVVERVPGWRLFLLWGVLALGFPLIQVYQPLRYFFLGAPALAYFAAVFIARVGSGSSGARAVRVGVLGIFVAFNVAYTTMNYVANRGNIALVVQEWVESNVDQEDHLMMAGHLATNVPNRAYAHYHYAGSPDELLSSLSDLDIAYVIWDEGEWSAWSREFLSSHFDRLGTVQEQPLIEVYRIKNDS